jgi:hypothetical protein
LIQQYKVTEHSLKQQTVMLQKEIHVKLMQEKEDQKMKFESLHAEAAKKYRQVEEKHLESLKENKKQGNMIESLQAEIASLQREKILLLQSLKEATTRSAEISKKCLKSYHRMMGLENQSFGLHTELVATKLECYEVTIQWTVKEKQGTLTCNHECSFEDKKGKCCRWEIGAVASFRSGVSSI